ncbi:hypothetical protein [Hymenobacter volaticus]|uniref:Uncharacterized protein n=1 Tax=Hymenobacter volaticus TaxID=2932254 RepID=A0ABY4G326_9BACT|nr:hypothetical protein [Hymenobacter volaticus]UOQ65275.1 hypothetical protein MUN86_17210 [Hymenobacter volaticus]
MSLLLKAPRGLLLVYPLFYILTFLLLRRLIQDMRLTTSATTGILACVVLAGTIFNLFRIQREIYAYMQTHYGTVARLLHARTPGPVRVVSTLGLGLRPFLATTDTVVVVTNEKELPLWRKKQFDYVLLDSYWRVTNSPNFDSLRHQPALVTLSEPLLTSPLLFLEHSEYTGLGYEQTLALQRAARQDSVQLRLYRLQ